MISNSCHSVPSALPHMAGNPAVLRGSRGFSSRARPPGPVVLRTEPHLSAPGIPARGVDNTRAPISLNVFARPHRVPTRAWREPDGGYSVPVRFARISKGPLDFHGEPNLLNTVRNESQPFTHLASGSRICRHGVLRLTNPSLQEQPA